MSSVKNGGVWKTILTPSVKNGGVWKPFVAGFVKNAGVWKQFYTAALSGALFPQGHYDIDNTSAAAGIRSVSLTLQTDGNLTGPGGQWFFPITAGVGSGYWVRFSIASGTGNVSGSALNTWLQINSPRVITISNTGVHALNAGSIAMQLSTDGGASVRASANCGYTVGYDA